MKERVLITGGSGFIGACLTRALIAQGQEVFLLLRPEHQPWRLVALQGQFHPLLGDLRDSASVNAAVQSARPDVIYNLATHGAYPAQQNRAAILATNIQGTMNLLEALSHRDYRCLVHAGSSSEYGQKNVPMHEEDRLEPATDYAVGKASASLLVLAEAYRGKPNCVVRVFSAYGPWEEPTRLVPYVMDCCIHGRNPEVTWGGQPRDFIHIDDVVALMITAGRLPQARGLILHAGTGIQQRVRTMIETIIATSNTTVVPAYGQRNYHQHEPECWVASIKKTQETTGWVPRHDLRSGIECTWRWLRQQTVPHAA